MKQKGPPFLATRSVRPRILLPAEPGTHTIRRQFGMRGRLGPLYMRPWPICVNGNMTVVGEAVRQFSVEVGLVPSSSGSPRRSILDPPVREAFPPRQ